MEKLKFKVDINAPRDRVWQTLWGETTYPDWCSAFGPGSVMEGELRQGATIYFLGSERNGMISTVDEIRPQEFISFRYAGVMNDGVEDLESEAAEAWKGGTETYQLTSEGPTRTVLEVTCDVAPEYRDDLAEAWPRGLDRLKALAERTLETA